MNCSDKFRRIHAGEGTKVEPDEVDGRPICDHPGCGKRLQGDGRCVEGHVQGAPVTFSEQELLGGARCASDELVAQNLLSPDDRARVRVNVLLAQMEQWIELPPLTVAAATELYAVVAALGQAKPFAPQIPPPLQARVIGSGTWATLAKANGYGMIANIALREHIQILEALVGGDFLTPPEHPTVQAVYPVLARVYGNAHLSASSVWTIAAQSQRVSNPAARAQVCREAVDDLLQTLLQKPEVPAEWLVEDPRMQALWDFVQAGWRDAPVEKIEEGDWTFYPGDDADPATRGKLYGTRATDKRPVVLEDMAAGKEQPRPLAGWPRYRLRERDYTRLFATLAEVVAYLDQQPASPVREGYDPATGRFTAAGTFVGANGFRIPGWACFETAVPPGEVVPPNGPIPLRDLAQCLVRTAHGAGATTFGGSFCPFSFQPVEPLPSAPLDIAIIPPEQR